MNRREFVHTSVAAAGALPGLASQTTPPEYVPGYSLKIMATDWGFRGTTEELCAAAKKEGYDGLELWWIADDARRKSTFASLRKHGLEVGFLCGAGQADFAGHLASFKKSIDGAIASELRPLYINCHSGRDFFSAEQNEQCIDYTVRATERSGVPIYHETHRGRMLFAAHIARGFIERNAKLRLTLDISHWCNVHESLLDNQPEAVALALARTDHIHARVGHAEGPQVNDPRAPEWTTALEAHLGWWDRVVAEKKRLGLPLTILTEFGPPHYLPTVPYTNQPLADQWGINVYMMRTLRQRYGS